MKILTAEQLRAWDNYTIANEPILSIDLMERAAAKCVAWLQKQGWEEKSFIVFCGKGNNGGDGLAIGRMLLEKGYQVSIYVLENGKEGSNDFRQNLQRLDQLPSTTLRFIREKTDFPELQKDAVVIDALFGSGLNKPLDGLSKELVVLLNNSTETMVVSIDLPSGLYSDTSSAGNTVVEADYTLTFQSYKMALLVQENASFIGEVTLIPIDLHPQYLQQATPAPTLLTGTMIREIFRPRNRFAHKGTYGHALLAGGSYGKMGALVLATKACLSSGAGLTTAHVPRSGYTIIQMAAPEAMTLLDENETHLSTLPADIERFAAIGIGPGMGTDPETVSLLSFLVRRFPKPMVIDADGLNCLSLAKDLLAQLPPLSVLTPHPKEFDHLFGDHPADFARIETAIKKAKALKIHIVLKSHHSLIATPDGECFFNSTGNAGMAKGGSGDVLTGILTSLLAQGYHPTEAVKMGVYLHGWAGDIAAEMYSQQSMLPSHLIACLPHVFKILNDKEGDFGNRTGVM